MKSVSLPTPGNKEYAAGQRERVLRLLRRAAPATGPRATTPSTSARGGCMRSTPTARTSPAARGRRRRPGCAQDLAANPRACQIAYWHHPLFNSGNAGSAGAMAAIWRRSTTAAWTSSWRPRPPLRALRAPGRDGRRRTPARPRAFIVGTGGASHGRPRDDGAVAANSEVRNYDTFGVLELTLQPAGFAGASFPRPAGRSRTPELRRAIRPSPTPRPIRPAVQRPGGDLPSVVPSTPFIVQMDEGSNA